jgi:hypothetical protein
MMVSAKPTTTPRKGSDAENDIQRIGNTVSSFFGVLVVNAVQFGLPLTPQQQVTIMNVIMSAWAVYAAIWQARHRVTRTRQRRQTTKVADANE